LKSCGLFTTGQSCGLFTTGQRHPEGHGVHAWSSSVSQSIGAYPWIWWLPNKPDTSSIWSPPSGEKFCL